MIWTVIRVKRLFVILLSVGLLATAAQADDIYPNPAWTSFFGSGLTFNGLPAPIGSIVDAYDPSGVHIGRDTVHTAGQFGYMPAYGDDPSTPLLDEGAVTGDDVVFKVNGRPATILSGNPDWSDQSTREVELTANGNIAMTALLLPQPTLVAPNQTRRFWLKVRNDGDVLDCYAVTSDPDDGNLSPDWTTAPQSHFSYGVPGHNTDLYFDVTMSNWINNPLDTVFTINFAVYSQLDPTVRIDAQLIVYHTSTDIDGDDPILPAAFSIAQNYPNPFNPSTTIAYNLPFGSPVTFEVFNVLGQTLESRDLGYQSPGDHQVEFVANQMASGIYFYRLTTEAGSLSKKMVLIK
jgi:hypothetical protein